MPPTNARQCAVHAGYDDDHVSGLEVRQHWRETVQPCDADVLLHDHISAQELRAYPRFVQDRSVGCPCGDDQDVTTPWDRVRLPRWPWEVVFLCVGKRLAHGVTHPVVGAGYEHARRAGFGQFPRDTSHLHWGFCLHP